MMEVAQNSSAMHSSTNSSSSEIVYGATGSVGSTGDDNRVMSEKVQMLASSIYKEFETMIGKNGEDSVKNLMPLVVNVLESLDLAYLEKEECSVDLEMLKEDNEQLITQYEREKQLRKAQDQKCLEIEDSLMEQNRELESKIESLESIMRMLELKAKNSSDHAARLEEREADQKAEFDKLHERYNVLLRTHIDHMERTKYLMGSEKFEMMQSMPLPSQQLRTKLGMAASVDASAIRGVSDLISAHMSQSTTLDVNLANHISSESDWHDEFGQNASDILQSPRDYSSSAVESPREAPPILPDSTVQSSTSVPTVVAITNDSVDSLGADLTGMGREVENLIKENTELLETKNALNIVKNDLIARVDELSSEQDILREEIRSLEMVRSKMGERIKELESDVRDLKEKLEVRSEDDQEDLPMAQRKRFTRLEMARVLLERNQYKEKLMELQEAMKWTEMQRAKRLNALNTKKSSGIWEFFSGLFMHEPPHSSNRRRRTAGSERDTLRRSNAKINDFMDSDYSSERRAAERRQQYKIVKEHMNREESDRFHAYGWSVPAVFGESNDSAVVPVPVFCRPLIDLDSSLKIWCSSSVTLRGGRTLDGGYIVDDSIFCLDPKTPSESTPLEKSINQLDIEHKEPMEDDRQVEILAWKSSSLLWVCSSNQRHSHVVILDANNPNSVIDTFQACSAHVLCVSSVPGVQEFDYPLEDTNWKNFCRGGGYVKDLPSDINEQEQFGAVHWVELRKLDSDEDTTLTYCGPGQKPSPQRSRDFSVCEQTGPSTSESNQGLNEVTELDALEQTEKHGIGTLPAHIKDRLNKYEGLSDNMTTLPTMWMGSQNDYIFIHSAVSKWRKCLRRIKMPDAVLSILHYKGRVFAALANGSIAVFHRDAAGGWSEAGYHCITVGRATSSVRSLSIVGDRLWAAYRNCIIVIDPKELTVKKVFAAHPRRDSQVRHMQWVGDGVWISIRLDSTLRLYHAYNYEHLQDIDIEPYVTKMLGTNNLDYSYMRTTALLAICRRLWIGTGTGVIISVPLSGTNENRVETKLETEDIRGPGGLIRVYGDMTNERISPGSFIPYCDMSHAQLSFHGHKDSVKFFLAVPGANADASLATSTKSLNYTDMPYKSASFKMLVVSGGDGYIDFRMGEEEDVIDVANAVQARDLSHLIVWELSTKPFF
ncbi:JNK-interacting protein, variant [Loa loa]|uniref:JNK-interacting protein, variant n=1 Tax=Loa loa TaxID=7209 RepID=A0A1S0UHZ2_LOALO|nr:JNK-interacting protein, variant [Loa loa]EJD75081.1 JNK-interacting protein, variant [Loa loa]